MAALTGDTLPAPKAVRLGVLVVGFPRKPFTVPVTIDTKIGDRLPRRIISELAALGSPAIYSTLPRPPDIPIHAFPYSKPYVALAAGEDPQRLLRLEDADTMKLMRPTSDKTTKKRYISDTKLIPGYAPIVPFLASRVGQDAADWQPQEGEIHIIVAVMLGDSRVDGSSWLSSSGSWISEMHWRQWPARPDLFATCSNRFDIEFHGSKPRKPISSFRLVRKLQIPVGGSIPAFHRVVVLRRRCGMESPPPPPREAMLIPPQPCEHNTPARLAKLAADAILPHLLRSDPPLFLDPVDCVVDAVLTTCNGKVVRDNVVCYIKFLPSFDGQPNYCPYRGCVMYHQPGYAKGYVNPAMLEQIDGVVTAGDERESSSSNTPLLRLLVLVKRYNPRDFRIDMSCLPTEYATVIVEYPIWT